MTTCAAAEKLAKLARDLGWTVEVRYRQGALEYQHKADTPRGDGVVPRVKIAEPVWSAGVYATRGDRVVAAWYVARDAAERRTPKGALSWTLDGALGRKLIGSGDTAGYTPTAFEQAPPAEGEKAGPTTLAQVQAYLTEHGQPAEPEQPELTIDLGSSAEPARPNWRTAA